MSKRKAVINRDYCVACGTCLKVCPKKALSIYKGMYAEVDYNLCVGCAKCSNICPAETIEMENLK